MLNSIHTVLTEQFPDQMRLTHYPLWQVQKKGRIAVLEIKLTSLCLTILFDWGSIGHSRPTKG